MKISIIIPNYNKEKYISESIKSVLKQSYYNWELIIIDDNSSDKSVEIIKKFRDKRIKFIINKKNKGANYCRNLGIKIAESNFVMFLDSDDLISPQCLENRIKIAKTIKADLYVFPTASFQKNIHSLKKIYRSNKYNLLKKFSTHNLPWLVNSVLWKKNTLISLGGFNEDFKRFQDVELHTKALILKKNIYICKENVVDSFYRIEDKKQNSSCFKFLNNHVTYGIKYCIIFSNKIKYKYLSVTYLYLISTLTYYHKNKMINLNELNVLADKIFLNINNKRVKVILLAYFFIESHIKINIKGLRLFFKFLILS